VRRLAVLAALALVACAGGEDRAASARSLFDGKTLDGWKGSSHWSVVDGAITGRSTKEAPLKANTFLVWQGGEVGDFELSFRYRIVGGNSGVQYRSRLVDAEKFIVAGYQADLEAGKTYSGILYEERGRGILANRGQVAVWKPGAKKPEVTGTLGKSDDIQARIRHEDWNDYRIVARAGHLRHFINGVATAEFTDESEVGARRGLLALQLHAGPAMTVQFKDLLLREIK
jgi:hypothetical protein